MTKKKAITIVLSVLAIAASACSCGVAESEAFREVTSCSFDTPGGSTHLLIDPTLVAIEAYENTIHSVVLDAANDEAELRVDLITSGSAASNSLVSANGFKLEGCSDAARAEHASEVADEVASSVVSASAQRQCEPDRSECGEFTGADIVGSIQGALSQTALSDSGPARVIVISAGVHQTASLDLTKTFVESNGVVAADPPVFTIPEGVELRLRGFGQFPQLDPIPDQRFALSVAEFWAGACAGPCLMQDLD